jgi:hypothetical protein
MTDQELHEKAAELIEIAVPGASAEILASLLDSAGTAAFWDVLEFVAR